MRTVTAKIAIDRPAGEIYEYLLDVGSRPEFGGDLFLDLRLARVDSCGVGAGARYRLHRKLRDRYAGSTITEAVRGELIREDGSTGRLGRVPLIVEFRLEQRPGGPTQVEFVVATHPQKRIDRLRETGLRRQINRKARRAVQRLRDILEGAPRTQRGERPTVAGLDLHHVPNP